IPAIKKLRALFWPRVVCEPYEHGRSYDAVIVANRFIRSRNEPPKLFDKGILDEVRKGLPLVVLAEGDAAAEAIGKELSDAGAFEYQGILGESRASWMGSWYFVRAHPLYDGLPVNCAMASYYQTPVTGGAGLIVDGKYVEVAAGYARDHSREIGAGSLTTKLGAGKIVIHTIPGMVSQLAGESSVGIHPVIFRRLLSNSLIYAWQ
ncbi:MAG TPA: hypothetical protein VK470_17485, partial [Bacteroidota bacterium]|nr:hypothetical protein [Bacteroidota bacterium]